MNAAQKQKIQYALQESLRYCLYHRDRIERYGPLGLDLMRRLWSTGLYIQLFAAVDLVCCFFAALLEPAPLFPTLQTNRGNENFASLYATYPAYLQSLFESALFRMLREDARRLITFERAGREDREKTIYRAFSFVLSELAMNCPFVALDPPFAPVVPGRLDWNNLRVPEREPMMKEMEEEILAIIGFGGKEKEKSAEALGTSGISPARSAANGRPAEQSRIDVLCSTVFHKYLDETEKFQKAASGKTAPQENSHEERVKYRRQIERIPQAVDYKVADLYLELFNSFEPSEELRRKISYLKRISRVSVDVSPFNQEYSRQWTSGMINPAYLMQGWQRFIQKLVEGEPVFLGCPTPLYEEDRISIRFYMLEELQASCEKVPEEKGGRPRLSHLNAHKLMALLAGHDIVKYLGIIEKMDISLEFVCFLAGRNDPVRNSGQMKTALLRQKVETNSGFMVKNRVLQNLLLTEASSHEIGVINPENGFYSSFFEQLDSKMTSGSGRHSRCYDFYFARGGLFLDASGCFPLPGQGDRGGSDMEEYAPSQGLARLLATRPYRVLPNHQHGFICETNSRYVLATGSEVGNFKSLAVDYGLRSFISSLRESILTAIANDAIRFRHGYFRRMHA